MAITSGVQRATAGDGLSGPAPHPVDITTMRNTAEELLGPDDGPGVLPPSSPELRLLTSVLRGHLDLLVPEVEAQVYRLSEDGVLRYCALACVGEARRKLSAEPCRRYGGEVGHARRLARVLRALCDQYEALARRLRVPADAPGDTNPHE
ncbi:DUF6415 family natural product biosynthesis protein [Streptomyces sp. NPDC094038]|uniref:DUF6415 family natural product biosynthesis protein n=1 Tax=Streptomyces sp. NPDC094038 TaxID=3366055 RepID=UPI00381F83C0